ncbi:tetratricopeptide repeat protein [Pelagibacteraceae bacterium]|nr:tetratricopeptide repeat protein [Pelagibacteraceae bacterium]
MDLISQINSILKKFETGDKFKSYKELQKIFKKNKDNNLIRYNLAVIQQNLNLNEEARINYNYLIKVEKNLKAMINLYNMDIIEANYYEALNTIENILKIKTIDNVNKDKAFVLYKLNRIEEAKKICIYYLKKNNKDLSFLSVIGQCLFHEKKYAEAIKIFENILEIEPKNLSALNSLARTYHEKREKVKAEEYYLKALEINKLSFYLLNNIAGFYREESSYDKAIAYYKQALSINPNNAYIYNNLAKIYFDINNHKEALENSFKALEMKKNDGDIQKTISFIYLKDHNFENGWKYFDGRLDLQDFREKNNYIKKLNKKLYRSITLKNKRGSFLVVREQGVGDEILYSSIYGDFLNDIHNTVIECDNRLLNLYKRSFPEYSEKFVSIGSITSDDQKLKKIDNVIYAGSLGRYYRKNIKDFKNNSFLKIDNKNFEEMQIKLSIYKKKYKVGLSWKSFNNQFAKDKSLNLKDLNNIFNLTNCDFFNLQYGDVENEISNFNSTNKNKLIKIENLDLFNDFDSIASLLKSLDVFVTISNTTAHLAGALGVKTILIKPENFAVFHYWNQKTDDTPWYNSVKLIDKKDFLQNSEFLDDYLRI